MKAVILAAGKGERLKNITVSTPKPMIVFKGKPIIQYNIELCKKYGIEDIYINVHHHAEQIKEYFGDGRRFGVKIEYSFEKELLGTSGAVKKIADEFWKGENQDDFFFVIYGDQFSGFNLSSMIKKINQYETLGVIAFHYREDVEHSGVSEFDDDYRITRFIEKPKKGETKSHWVNAGIYLLKKEIMNFIPKGVSDFAKEIFPQMLKSEMPLYGICEKLDVRYFDTIEMYNKNIR